MKPNSVKKRRVTHVDNARRCSSLREEVHHHQGRSRVLFRRFYDASVASDECGWEHPQWNHDGEVEGCHTCYDKMLRLNAPHLIFQGSCRLRHIPIARTFNHARQYLLMLYVIVISVTWAICQCKLGQNLSSHFGNYPKQTTFLILPYICIW